MARLEIEQSEEMQNMGRFEVKQSKEVQYMGIG